MSNAASTGLFTATLAAAISLALLLNADDALGAGEAVDIRDAPIDALLTAGVRLEDGHAYLRQLHVEDGELIALTIGVGAPAPWLEQVLPSRTVSLTAEEALYDLSAGHIHVTATAHELLARPLQDMPLARAVPIGRVAPSALFGAPVTEDGAHVGHVAGVFGGAGVERLRVQTTTLDGRPAGSRMIEADCVRFVPIMRQVDASACPV